MTEPAKKPAYQTIAPIDYSRIEQAMKEVGHTDVSRSTALTLIVAFLALIIIVPLVDTVHQLRKGERVASLDLARNPPTMGSFVYPIHERATPERNRFVEFEKDVEKASLIRTTVQKQGQSLFTGIFDLGNQKVLIGRDGWLFFRPGIDHVAGYGFFDHRQHKIRPRFHGDPLAAVTDLAEQCRAAGVALVLMPVSDKAQLHPEQVTARFATGTVPRNPHDQRFLDGVAAAGVTVVDPLAALQRAKAERGAAFLAQDTHWTPEAMDAVAAELAAAVARLGVAVPAENPWHEAPLAVTQIGDLVGTLNLPDDQRFFTTSTVTVRQVQAADGSPWRSDASAPVALLGDSFCNIYHDGDKAAGGLGWGASAGLGARLAWHLRQGIDQVAINGGEANGARKLFARRDAPLAGKRVVVWQISMRDLSVSEWDLVSFAARIRTAPVTTATEAVRDGATVTAKLVTTLPGDAGDVSNYPNNLLVLVFAADGREFLVRTPGVIGRIPQPLLNQAQPGRTFRITLSKSRPATLPEAADNWTPVGDDGRLDLDDFWAATITPVP